jgi:cell division septation protein DedD
MDPTLREARMELMAADREGAARMYAAWLDAHPGSPSAPIVFNRYFDTEQSLPELVENAGKFLKTARQGNSLPEVLARIGRLFEVVGMTEQAREVYLSAYAQGAPFSALESAFLLSLEMNDLPAMQSALAGLKDGSSERAELLTACVAYQQGDNGPAAAALTRIVDSAVDQSVILKALWLRYRIAVQSGDAAARQDAVKLLRERFPRSPEYALAAAEEPVAAAQAPGSVTLLALPGSFLRGQPAPLPEPAPSQSSPNLQPDDAGSASPGSPGQAASAGTGAPQQPVPGGAAAASQKTLSVQAGSFQMKENADDLISQLAKNGFAPTLRTDAAQGKLLFRVFVGRGLSSDEARALLDKLHGAGFSGFMMSDQ